MEANRKYTTMVFPQGFDGTHLQVHIVLIPRNQDPFKIWPTGVAGHENSTPFADLVPQFEVVLRKGLEEWPIGNIGANTALPVTVDVAVNKKAALEGIAKQLGAKINMDGSSATKTDKAPDTPLPENQSVQKYLPESYRTAFNFTNPRHPNAKLDDSYHCAVKKDTPKDKNWKTNDDLSWGQVFAHILRQPMLARACGMIYTASIDLTAHADVLVKGGFIFVNMVDTQTAAVQEDMLEGTQGPFVKRYAARIPALTMGTKRPVFAPMLFPVLHKQKNAATDPIPQQAEWDKIFAELNEYNDGYAKIIHAGQQVSNNILSERQDGPAPQTDTGIRLAWDDEQIMIWYLRQLSANPMEPGKRLDVPMGVYGYRIDVRNTEAGGDWRSLNRVESQQTLMLGDANLGGTPDGGIELPFQVFPSQLDNNTNAPYWLPMYFTNWIGRSLVLKDTDAIRINRHADGRIKHDDPLPNKAVDASSPYNEVPSGVDLTYGNTYEFQVRMMDISGGGPVIGDPMVNNAPSPLAKHTFKRYVAPDLCRVILPEALRQGASYYFNKPDMNEDGVSIPNPTLEITRPLLNYPAVVFTDKYQKIGQNPVDLLIASTGGAAPSKVPGIADPDVTHVEIKVEIETLKLDNLLSESGQENYITLYTTNRAFPAGFEDTLSLPVVFYDVPVLLAGNSDEPFNRADLNKAAIDAMSDIPLPTARRIRMTVRAVCAEQPGYFGFSDPADKNKDTRYGKTSQFWFHEPSTDEADLLLPVVNVPALQGIYLQPDPPLLNSGVLATWFLTREAPNNMPDIVQRFAQKLGLRNNGLTIMGRKGERVVFGCSNRIRHHLAPDHSSITFSSKGDLCNHWLGCIAYRLNRDWTWNGLEDVSFQIKRKRKFERDKEEEAELINVLGDIELKRSASFECLQDDEFGETNREYTTLIFIDAIEPKSVLEKLGGGLRFPDELNAEYELTPRFRPNHGAPVTIKSDVLHLPTTIIPAQVPEIASVGIAFSPYLANERYSATEPRQRYLWVELKEAIKDPHDTLFCRVLAYAPDQLLSHSRGGIMTEVPEEPALPIDPEYIRAITPGQTDDMAGMGAMQPMEKASGSKVHYLLPLPPGLNPESPELFGFFTYEFRVGHAHGHMTVRDPKGDLWSTAQGRFGRPLRVTGMQHPAPNLLCNVNRDKDRVYVTAPYAKAVWQGRNVTCTPPRTQLHGLLYAQVRQADGKGYRNILLDERLMVLDKPIVIHPGIFTPTFQAAQLQVARWTADQVAVSEKANVLVSHLSLLEDKELNVLRLDTAINKKLVSAITARRAGKVERLDATAAAQLISAYEKINWKETMVPAAAAITAGNKFTAASLVAGAKLAILKDAPKTATVYWTNKEISLLLYQLGLPQDASLSVVVVEVFGNISSVFEQLGMPMDQVEVLMQKRPEVVNAIKQRQAMQQQALSNQLGNYRILRTSPLTEVPFVCCTTCG
ncbi:hypothetical protein [Paraflavitalea pollutisoli]|uniref:hypothetical protein n=1 Tax=Paraflavitalea pollutisoli TaxID=3034143 RepID=UPI0023EDC960|nr:hypothetical protein [Paraflavitalea sp. H1-2-19X]